MTRGCDPNTGAYADFGTPVSTRMPFDVSTTALSSMWLRIALQYPPHGENRKSVCGRLPASLITVQRLRPYAFGECHFPDALEGDLSVPLLDLIVQAVFRTRQKHNR